MPTMPTPLNYDVDGVIAINSALRLNNLQVSYIVPTLHAFNEMISHLHAKGIKDIIVTGDGEEEIFESVHRFIGDVLKTNS